jgi:glycosyltransferase involved in cell wall biosynthesis
MKSNNSILPLVSILMTAYNREQFIAEAIESVLSNSYQDFELIIVDDGSKDQTVNIAKKYADTDTRIKVNINEKNLGDYPNRNKAASYASGVFMMYVDSDDKLNPDTINKILGSVADVNALNFAMYWPHSNDTFTLNGKDALDKHFNEKQFLYMGPGGTFIRRDFFYSIGCYPVKYGPANDMYFNLKACCYSGIHLFPFEFIYYRIHAGQEINNTYGYLFNNYNYMKDALEGLPLPFPQDKINWLQKKNKRRFLVNVSKYFIKTFNLKKTISACRKTQFTFSDFLEALIQ